MSFKGNFMLTEELEYHLPKELIAQTPPDRRDQSRLLVYNRATQGVSHHTFTDLPQLLESKLAIFRNNVSVLKARIIGNRPSGGAVECLLLRRSEHSSKIWKCLLKPGGKTAKAQYFGYQGEYSAEVLEAMETGEYLVRFSLPKDADPPALAQRIGKLPLPPYVQRPASKEDETRYQTVYANGENRSAVAAPTAGLHFTNKILNELKNSGHSIYDLSLSVGLGTFRPIETSKIEDHPMHAEEYFLPNETGQALFQKDQKRLAIGTTCVRAIEHFLSATQTHPGRPIQAEANLFIRPPYEFLGVDHLLTNFHLPGSTLLCLVAAFLAPNKCHGLQKLKELYAEAISQKYRFFSYGDAMLII